MVSERVRCRSFIGRGDDLMHVVARRRAAAESRGGLVLVAGEAGIGKSRFVAEYRRRFANSARGVTTVAACRAFAQRPLGPIAEILSQLGGADANPLTSVKRTREEQIEAIVASFDAATRRRTVTAIVEDLHWADTELVQTLTILAHWASTKRLLLVCTYRDDEVLPSSPIFQSFGALARAASASHIKLLPLEGAELTDFLDDLLGALEYVALDTQTVEEIASRSGGNPFFVEELVRHAADARRARGRIASRELPLSLHGVILERLGRCKPAERTLLEQAAVFGRSFRLDLLGDVFGFDPSRLSAALHRLVELQLVEPVEGDALAFEFRHALVHGAVYDEIPRAQARRLHAEVVRVVAMRPDADEHLELLAHSAWEAGDAAGVARYGEAAGDAANRVYANDDAVRWYERAAQAHTQPAAVARVLGKAALVASRTDDQAHSSALNERAFAAYAQGGDVGQEVELALNLAATYFNDGRSDAAFGVLERALQRATDHRDAALRNRVLMRMAAARAALRNTAAAWTSIAQVDESAINANDFKAFEYFLTKSSLYAQERNVSQWRDAFERALELLARTNAPPQFLRYSHGSISVQALHLGEMEAARAHAQAGYAIAKEVHAFEAYMLTLIAELELCAGNLAAVRTHLQQLRASPRQDFLVRHNIAMLRARLAARISDDEMLAGAVDRELIREAKAGGNNFAVAALACAFAPCLALQGNRAEGAALLHEAAAAIETLFGNEFEVATICRWAPDEAASLLRLFDNNAGDRVSTAMRALVDAAQCRKTAAKLFAEIGWPLLAAEALEGGGDDAAAIAIYRACGALGEVRRLERPSLMARDSAWRGLLTPREREVAQIVASGRDNAATAEALSISRKAVEKYLTSIYGKLGVGSRGELAAYILGNGGSQ
jgi:predicted ATPase/DNA-binding CsgD family transcriptional regulator